MHIFTAEKGINDLEEEIKQLQEQALEGREEDEVKEPPKKPSESFIEKPTTDEKPLDKEEETFKKRYGDLRRHAQKQEQALKEQIAELQQNVDQLKTRPTMGDQPPTNPEEVKAWVEKYPQVAAIISALAEDQAKKLYGNDIQQIKQETTADKKNKELKKIYEAHDDFDEIKISDSFHDWVESQPKFVQDHVYKGSADQVIWTLNMYKESLEPKVNKDKEAAKPIGKTQRDAPTTDSGKRRFTESEIDDMPADEYEAQIDEINEAIREGRMVYDMSGGAR